MGLLPDTQNCGLCMRRECREHFPRHWLQRKPLVSDSGVTHVPWCKSGLPTRGGGENVPGIPGACTTLNFTYLARGPWNRHTVLLCFAWVWLNSICRRFLWIIFLFPPQLHQVRAASFLGCNVGITTSLEYTVTTKTCRFFFKMNIILEYL